MKHLLFKKRLHSLCLFQRSLHMHYREWTQLCKSRLMMKRLKYLPAPPCVLLWVFIPLQLTMCMPTIS